MAQEIKKKKNVQKQFFEVKAPLTSTKIMLYAASTEELEGRTIKLDMTKNLRGKNLELIMKVKKGENGLEAYPISSRLVSAYMRRMVRKGTDYVEDSFTTKCKDYELVVKPFLITRKKVSRAVRNELRKSAQEYLKGIMTPKTSLELFSDIMVGKIQKELSLRLKKIYPLALCEIRIFEIIDKKD
ncbi:MAG: hypothetical protein AABX35_02920 [Nanoarchaeota archaeon]